jgi:hypothetical protein
VFQAWSVWGFLVGEEENAKKKVISGLGAVLLSGYRQ